MQIYPAVFRLGWAAWRWGNWGSETWFGFGSDTGLTTSFENVGLTPAQGAEFIGHSVEAAIAESEYDKLWCALSTADKTASTALVDIAPRFLK
ncbi:hypothetical protein SBOR_4320 [Sclerotinia borealis F-4128]|uniref:Uncharacterized protein n=1 Tax=Sclerotinia borealis (strain F-4128) TaxID=1432307 RepID=W9CH94_SCLBF|nr:hypothetical protein SBOR_4320 [Sclerotinia borealis F-4128]